MGSHGVGKGPTKVTSICRRHRGALLFVLYNIWRHLPSQAQGKINIPIKLLHFSREIVHFALPGFVGTSLLLIFGTFVIAVHFGFSGRRYISLFHNLVVVLCICSFLSFFDVLVFSPRGAI